MDRVTESRATASLRLTARYLPFVLVPLVPAPPLALLFIVLGWVVTVQALGARDGVGIATLATVGALLLLWIRLSSVSMTIAG